MKLRRATVAVALLLAVTSGDARAADSAATDPRLARANALLGDRDRYPEAIALYQEILRDEPDHVEARLWLARVQAWSGRYDESLDHYERLLATDPPPKTAAVERAEVLSWAGRYEAAEAAFRALVDADPGHARAWLGLARVHAWSGRRLEADRLYARTLELDDDPEVRAERAALHETEPAWVGARAEWFADNEDFERRRALVEASLPLSLAQGVSVRVGALAVRGESPLAEEERDRAPELELAWRRRLSDRLRAELTVGGRAWRHGPSRGSARLRVEIAPNETTQLTASVEHRDHLDFSDSFLAVQEGIVGTYPRATLWKALGEHWEAYTALGFGWLNDHNRRLDLAGSLSFRPWLDEELRVGVDAGWLRYEDDSPFYYSPESDLGARLSVSYRAEPLPGLSIDARAGYGYGQTRELGESSSGPEASVALDLVFRHAGWRAELGGALSRSQRAIRYTSETLHLRLVREF